MLRENYNCVEIADWAQQQTLCSCTQLHSGEGDTAEASSMSSKTRHRHGNSLLPARNSSTSLWCHSGTASPTHIGEMNKWLPDTLRRITSQYGFTNDWNQKPCWIIFALLLSAQQRPASERLARRICDSAAKLQPEDKTGEVLGKSHLCYLYSFRGR